MVKDLNGHPRCNNVRDVTKKKPIHEKVDKINFSSI